MDELTTTGPSTIHELRDGKVTTRSFDPAEVGIDVVPVAAVAGGDPQANVAIAHRVFDGEVGPHRDIVTLNAAAALVVAGLADDLTDGLERARDVDRFGIAAAVLDRLVSASQAAAEARPAG